MFLKSAVVVVLLATCIAGQVRVPLVKSNFINLHLDSRYKADIEVGTPRQKLSCLVHTGSDITAVAGKDCTTGCEHVQHRFDPSQSSTFKSGRVTQAADWEGRFGASGRNGVDTFTVNNTEVLQQNFIVANVLEPGYSQIEASCVLGVNNGKNTVFNSMIEQHLLGEDIMFLHHQRLPDGEHFGQIVFGAIDTSVIREDPTYVPLLNDNSWTVKIDDVTLDGESVCNGDCKAYVDTSIAIIKGPPVAIQKLNQKIGCTQSSDKCEIACERIPSLKPIEFTLGGHKFQIEAEYYIQQEGSKCWSGFVPDSLQSQQWRLGDFFLDHIYVVFDHQKKRVGFAHAKE